MGANTRYVSSNKAIFEDVPLIGFLYLVFTRRCTSGGVYLPCIYTQMYLWWSFLPCIYTQMYLWWILCTLYLYANVPLYLHASQVRVTVSNSGLCCRVCVTSFGRFLTPLCVHSDERSGPPSVSDYDPCIL